MRLITVLGSRCGAVRLSGLHKLAIQQTHSARKRPHKSFLAPRAHLRNAPPTFDAFAASVAPALPRTSCETLSLLARLLAAARRAILGWVAHQGRYRTALALPLRQAMDGSESPQDELLGGFDFLGDIDPVLWDELNSREPGSSSDNNFTFAAAAPTLRCVDSTHNSATCTKCTACPPAELAHKYELMGEDGKVRLRQLP